MIPHELAKRYLDASTLQRFVPPGAVPTVLLRHGDVTVDLDARMEWPDFQQLLDHVLKLSTDTILAHKDREGCTFLGWELQIIQPFTLTSNEPMEGFLKLCVRGWFQKPHHDQS